MNTNFINNMASGDRNYSIDLLKILSMIMVLGLHTNNYGGFLKIERPEWYVFVIHYYEHLCIVAVNVFIIISSWFLRGKTTSISKVISILLAILFWTVVSLFFVKALGQEVSLKWIFKSVPFVGRAYDFLSGYLILYMLSPLLNNMLDNSSYKQKALLAFGSIIVFSILAPITSSHYLQIHGGYSCVWFICLFFITAFIKECPINNSFSKSFFLISYLLLSLLATIAGIYHVPILGSLDYNNSIVAVCSFSLFMLFKNISINSKLSKKTIGYFTPMTLGVFLIHDHNLMEQYYLTLGLSDYLLGVEFLYIICFPLFVLLIYLFCSFLEYMRIKLFEFVKIPQMINSLSLAINKSFDSMLKI